MAHERRLAAAVCAHKGHVLRVTNGQSGYAQHGARRAGRRAGCRTAFSYAAGGLVASGRTGSGHSTAVKRKRTRRSAKQHLARAGLHVHPHAAVVASLHKRRLRRTLRALQARSRHGAGPSRNPVLAGNHSAPDLLARVMVTGVHTAKAPPRRRLLRPLAPALRLSTDARGLRPCDVAGMGGLGALALLLGGALAPRARAHDGAARPHEQAAPTQPVQQLAVVRNQEPDAAKLRERAHDRATRGSVHVVGGLVHHQQVRALPQRHGNLQALALAAGKLVKAPRPIVLHAQARTQAHGVRGIVARELRQARGRHVRVLLAHRAHRPVRERALAWRKLPAHHARERGLAAAVVAHDATPPRRQRKGNAREHGLCRTGIRIANVGEIHLQGRPPHEADRRVQARHLAYAGEKDVRAKESGCARCAAPSGPALPIQYVFGRPMRASLDEQALLPS